MWITLLGNTFLLLAVWVLLKYLNQKYFILALAKRVRTQDGSPLENKVFLLPGKTIFGNNFDLFKLTPRSLFEFVRNACVKSGGRSFLMYNVFGSIYHITRADDAKEVFQSPKLINKALLYNLLRPLLGDGLVTSSGDETRKFIVVLDRNVGNDLDIKKIVPQITQNIVCESALGVKLDNMDEGAQYRKAIKNLESIFVERFSNPPMYWWPYFRLFGYQSYQKHVTNLKITNDFSSQIIKRKRQLFRTQNTEALDCSGRKRRFALLDTLLLAEQEGLIDHQGICEEVDTFIAAGYDTVSTCLIFALLMLSLHEDVQEHCFEEVKTLPADVNEHSVFHLNALTFLECVIKETLRLFPPVAVMGRECVEECVVNGLIMPKGTQILIHSIDIMRDPTHFPNPTKFQPERFLPENTVNVNPFAFMAFSAGQRNCIGQKFAMLEMKALLVSVLRNFKLLPVTRLEDVTLEYGAVLRSQSSVNVRFERRSNFL